MQLQMPHAYAHALGGLTCHWCHNPKPTWLAFFFFILFPDGGGGADCPIQLSAKMVLPALKSCPRGGPQRPCSFPLIHDLLHTSVPYGVLLRNQGVWATCSRGVDSVVRVQQQRRYRYHHHQPPLASACLMQYATSQRVVWQFKRGERPWWKGSKNIISFVSQTSRNLM